MPSRARSAGTGATRSPVPSSASMRWITVSCAIRRIQKPTVWSGVYQEPAGSSGLRVANSLIRSAYARSSSANGSSAASSFGGHGSGSTPSRIARVLCRYTSPTWRVRSATVQPGQLGTAAAGSVGTRARRRAKSVARQSRNREYSMPDIYHKLTTFRRSDRPVLEVTSDSVTRTRSVAAHADDHRLRFDVQRPRLTCKYDHERLCRAGRDVDDRPHAAARVRNLADQQFRCATGDRSCARGGIPEYRYSDGVPE